MSVDRTCTACGAEFDARHGSCPACVTLTPARRKALEWLAAAPRPITSRGMAKAMWPDSPGWQRPHRCGVNGSSRGAAMPMVAGAFLHKMARDGLVAWTHESPESVGRWSITALGRKALGAAP